jgi:FkbH-like protein
MDIQLFNPLQQSKTLAGVVIAASFTADPLVEPTELILRETGLALPVSVAPYGQPFQQLLDAGSLFAQNTAGVNVLLVRLEDWLRGADGVRDLGPDWQSKLARNVADLAAAVRACAQRAATSMVVGVCPSSPAAILDDSEVAVLLALERDFRQELSGLATVHLLDMEGFSAWPAPLLHDSEQNRIGHVPYTSRFFAVLARDIARLTFSLKTQPIKVLVLDCDNTLWSGVVGEDGVAGLGIGERERDLQRFALEKKKSGVLLCLASKNSEADVIEVFEKRKDMVLQLSDIVAMQVHWQAKSESIRALSQQLNLDLDSFAFVDDSPLECAEVRMACPEVLVLGLRPDEDTASFLRNVWPLDLPVVTDEDRRRSDMFRANLERDRSAKSATDMAAFIADLNLQIEIAPPNPGQIARVAQLTQRTNQFNFTTRRRSAAEIAQLDQQGQACLAVEVRDRFGDYGLVGLVIYGQGDEALLVDTFLLSCRVLGRGVEHAIVRELGRIASRQGKQRIEMTFLASKRNMPARRFLDSLVAQVQETGEDSGGSRFTITAEAASALAYLPGGSPSQAGSDEKETAAPPAESQASSMPGVEMVTRSARWNRLARRLDTPENILAVLRAWARSERNLAVPLAEPQTATEARLRTIWSDVLGVSGIGTGDDYYGDLGGTSLQAVAIFARIERELGMRLPLVELVEAPTIAQLAARIDRPQSLQSLVVLHTGGSGVPLFLVHDADGEILLYRNLAQRLGDRPVYGIQPYARPESPIVHTRIHDMAAHYIGEIRALYPHGPYLLGGLCAGGVLAYEMALQLEDLGESARLVAVFDAADVEAERQPNLDNQRRFGRLREACEGVSPVRMARIVAGKLRRYTRYQIQRTWSQARDRFSIAGLRVCHDLGISPPAWLHTIDIRRVYNVAESEYRPRRALRHEIVLFRASDGEGADEPYRRLYRDPLLGWNRRSLQGARGYDVPGGHGSMLQEPNVAVIAEILRPYLTSVSGAAKGAAA